MFIQEVLELHCWVVVELRESHRLEQSTTDRAKDGRDKLVLALYAEARSEGCIYTAGSSTYLKRH